MITFILPGYSPKNKEWAEDVAKNLKIEGEIRVTMWDHWDGPSQKFDVREKAKLSVTVVGDRVVNIIAHSVGTVVAAYIIKAIPEKVGKVILNGIPINDLHSEDPAQIESALRKISDDKIICYQNESDPHGSFEQAKELINKSNPRIKIISKPRNDHFYPYYAEFNNFLED